MKRAITVLSAINYQITGGQSCGFDCLQGCRFIDFEYKERKITGSFTVRETTGEVVGLELWDAPGSDLERHIWTEPDLLREVKLEEQRRKVGASALKQCDDYNALLIEIALLFAPMEP